MLDNLFQYLPTGRDVDVISFLALMLFACGVVCVVCWFHADWQARRRQDVARRVGEAAATYARRLKVGTMTLEEAEVLQWGTYGKGAVEENVKWGTPLPPMQLKPLCDLDNEHLNAILSTQPLNAVYRTAIEMVLAARHQEGVAREHESPPEPPPAPAPAPPEPPVRRREAIEHSRRLKAQRHDADHSV